MQSSLTDLYQDRFLRKASVQGRTFSRDFDRRLNDCNSEARTHLAGKQTNIAQIKIIILWK